LGSPLPFNVAVVEVTRVAAEVVAVGELPAVVNCTTLPNPVPAVLCAMAQT